MGNFIDLSGERFGRLLVLERCENLNKEVAFLCKCDCGNEVNVRARSLRDEVRGTKSCGCIKSETEDLIGKKYNCWTVIEFVGKTPSNNSIWLCECDCVNKTRRNITDSNLKHGRSNNCGCLNVRNRTHGKSRSKNKLERKIYKAWSSFRVRCNTSSNKLYSNYGGRGIKVCEEWDNLDDGFMKFYNWSMENGVNLELTIDRIDVNGNYEPSNCRWADYKTQNNNRRDNRNYIINGEKLTITQWAERYDIHPQTVIKRVDAGWDIFKALNEPVDIKKRSVKKRESSG